MVELPSTHPTRPHVEVLNWLSTGTNELHMSEETVVPSSFEQCTSRTQINLYSTLKIKPV
jgi:hypothetical protein